jgi:hypothetical protein
MRYFLADSNIYSILESKRKTIERRFKNQAAEKDMSKEIANWVSLNQSSSVSSCWLAFRQFYLPFALDRFLSAFPTAALLTALFRLPAPALAVDDVIPSVRSVT